MPHVPLCLFGTLINNSLICKSSVTGTDTNSLTLFYSALSSVQYSFVQPLCQHRSLVAQNSLKKKRKKNEPLYILRFVSIYIVLFQWIYILSYIVQCSFWAIKYLQWPKRASNGNTYIWLPNYTQLYFNLYSIILKDI